MIIRQLKLSEFEYLHQQLIQKAQTQPLEASYTVDISYTVKIQPERHCKLAILQALRIDRDKDGTNFELITSGTLLSALLEIFIYQGVR